jgi:serine/threonine-protein kinase
LRWIGWARSHGNDALAFHDREIGIRPDSVGEISIFHSAAGTACVEALVANACGDGRWAGRAAATFATASRLPCASVDLTVGRASTVLGATLLCEALAGTGIAERCGLLDLADETLARILGGLPAGISDEHGLRLRGIAHGWAGVLYAALRWCEATAARVPAVVGDRVEELAALARTIRGSVSWHGPHDMPMAGGWCHGPAGYAHLWATASRVLDDTAHADRALRAAEASWAHSERTATLCCGSAGQAYAMLVAHQVSGDTRWVAHAHELAGRAAREAGTRWCLPNSLWKGDVGIALLAADLERPLSACMPLFGHEGWPATAVRDKPRVIAGLR